MKTLLVIDGNNIAHRVKYKFQLSNGVKDVSITYGFFKVMVSYLKLFKPYAVMVAWDGGIPKYRRDATPSYKANRTHHDELDYENFKQQVAELHTTALPLAGVLSIMQRYVEADDFAYQACVIGDYDRCVVVSADDDLLQCTLLEDVYVYDPNKKTVLGREHISNAYGVDPSRFVECRALQGDSSDNLPGVKGVGPKKAAKLFEEWHSLEQIFSAAEDGFIAGAMKANICEFGMEGAISNMRTMLLKHDRTGARLSLLETNASWKPANAKQLKRWFMDNAFVSMMDGDVYNAFKQLDMPHFQSSGLFPRPYEVYRSPQ